MTTEKSRNIQARSPESEARADSPQSTAQPTIKWDDSNMRSSYANVCNVSSTREEVVLMFGINQAWNVAQREVTVQLSERIILTPSAAKRLVNVLSNVMREYEGRFGEIPT